VEIRTNYLLQFIPEIIRNTSDIQPNKDGGSELDTGRITISYVEAFASSLFLLPPMKVV